MKFEDLKVGDEVFVYYKKNKGWPKNWEEKITKITVLNIYDDINDELKDISHVNKKLKSLFSSKHNKAFLEKTLKKIDIATNNENLSKIDKKVSSLINKKIGYEVFFPRFYPYRILSGLKSKTEKIPAAAFKNAEEKVIAIGASTGGIEAITKIVSRFPAETPGVVIVQHMPPIFTTMFADRLNSKCDMLVKEAAKGDIIKPGLVLVAPGDKHLRVEKSASGYRLRISDDDKVCGHRPSVEVMMQSIAKHVGQNAVGIMLSGMGSDGANGMLAMRRAGARTMAQDEATSIVFGMPKEAFERGGAERLLPLQKIAAEVIRLLS